MGEASSGEFGLYVLYVSELPQLRRGVQSPVLANSVRAVFMQTKIV